MGFFTLIRKVGAKLLTKAATVAERTEAASSKIARGKSIFGTVEHKATEAVRSGELSDIQKVLNAQNAGTSGAKAKFAVPKGVCAAPRPGFNETAEAYANLIKQNKGEVSDIIGNYLSHHGNEEVLAKDFMKFLQKRMNLPVAPKMVVGPIEDSAKGFFNANDISIHIDPSKFNDVSSFFSAIMHETHHFLQTKEMMLSGSIEKFSKKFAQTHWEKLVEEHPQKALLKTNPKLAKEIKAIIEEDAKATAENLKAAGWEEIISKYSKNAPGSAAAERGEKLLHELSHYDWGAGYYKQLYEQEAHELMKPVELEIEEMLGRITKKEKETLMTMQELVEVFWKKHPAPGTQNAIGDFYRNHAYDLIKWLRVEGITDPAEGLNTILRFSKQRHCA